ncbi:MAG: hypothetical protein ACR2JE_03300 [Acidobacteriaceae bacterium]
MMAFLRFSGLSAEIRRFGLPLAGAALLLLPLSGCGLHKKPKPAAITLTPPPTLRQVPLYTSDMGGKAPTLPPLPGPDVPAAQPSPPASPEPRKAAAPTPVHHAKPSPAKPAGESDTSASTSKEVPAASGPDGSTAPPAPPAVSVANKTAAGDTVASPIGQLTTGNTPDAGQSHHDAGDLIHSTQNGVNNLKRTLSAEETKIVIQIHSFLQQAQKALDNGDNDGAYTLATKAHVLLDELTPASQ